MLQVNKSKTEHVITFRNGNKRNKQNLIQMDSHNFERVSRFKYIKLILTENNTVLQKT